MNTRTLNENEKIKGVFLGEGSVTRKKDGQSFKTLAIETDKALEEIWLSPALERAMQKADATPGKTIVIYRAENQDVLPTEETRKLMKLQKDETVSAAQFSVYVVPTSPNAS